MRFYPSPRMMQDMARPGRKPKPLIRSSSRRRFSKPSRREPVGPAPKEEAGSAKDPAAVALRRKGGLKGGPVSRPQSKRNGVMRSNSIRSFGESLSRATRMVKPPTNFLSSTYIQSVT